MCWYSAVGWKFPNRICLLGSFDIAHCSNSLSIFSLGVLCIFERELFKSLIVIILMLLSTFICVNIYFIYLGALMLGAH